MSEWGFRIEMTALPQMLREFLTADLAYFVAEYKMKLWNDMMKMQTNRGFKFMLFNAMKKAGMRVDLETMRITTETLNLVSSSLITYKITDDGNKTMVEMHFSDILFEIQKGITGFLPERMNTNVSKKRIMAKFEAEMSKVYKHDFKIIELV